MYYYIYDNYLMEGRFKKTINNIEARLTDLGINGKIIRLSVLKNLSKSIGEDIAKGAKNLIIIGNDKTLNQVINIVDCRHLTIGYIPVGQHTEFSGLLGITEGVTACNALSSRLIEKVRLGTINNQYKFLTQLELAGSGITLNCDNGFTISTKDKDDIIIIYNNYVGEHFEEMQVCNNSGHLNIFIKNIKKQFLKAPDESFSSLSSKIITIKGDRSTPILLYDEKRILKTPITVSLWPHTVNFIVGKKRFI